MAKKRRKYKQYDESIKNIYVDSKNEEESNDNTKKGLRIHLSIQHRKYRELDLEQLPTIVFVPFSSIF